MTQETAKKYTLTAHDIQAYLCELGIKPTEEVSIYSIEYYFDKLPVTTDEISVEKLEPIGYYNESHGFLHDESDKDCYCQGGCTMEAVYTESQVKELTGTTDDHWYGFITHQNRVIESDEKLVEKLQEQLNTTKKALTEIAYGEYDTFKLSAVPIAKQALAALEGSGDE